MPSISLVLCLMACVALGPSPGHTESRAGAETPSRQEALSRMREPTGSLSLGSTSGGSLQHGKRVGLSGGGWAFFRHIKGRGTHFGTKEMAELLSRLGARIQAEHPGSVMGIGNISLDGGGKSPWHHSHQTGRDVDIAMFGLSAAGKPLNPKRFVFFGEDGVTAGRRPQSFDAARNLTLVRSLLEDESVTVQWIFCAEYLKQSLLEEARKQQLPSETVERLGKVLHQPTDSSPHADHFHVRIFCSVEDRLHGCLERGPLWPWANLGDEAYQTRVDELAAVVRMSDTGLRVRAIDWLRRIRARPALDRLIGWLEDDSEPVRRASLRALRAIADDRLMPGLLAVTSRAEDPAWAAQLFQALRVLWTSETAPIALKMLGAPHELLHPTVAGGSLAAFQITAARILERHGRYEAATTLLPLLDAPQRNVRRAARTALVRITNHELRGDVGRLSGRKRTRVIGQWTRLLDRFREAGWIALLTDGFGPAGYRFEKGIEDPHSIGVLMSALGDRRTTVRHNAVRVLSHVTGHRVSPYARGAKSMRRHWARWWAEHEADYRARHEGSVGTPREETPQEGDEPGR